MTPETSTVKIHVEEPLTDGRTKVSVSIQETIPTAPYANIQLFASVTKIVDDPVEGLAEAFEEVEKGRDPKREEILLQLEEGNN